jgi:hypothetical protein
MASRENRGRNYLALASGIVTRPFGMFLIYQLESDGVFAGLVHSQ